MPRLSGMILALLLLLLDPIHASTAAPVSVLEEKAVRLPPVKSCQVLINITSAEFHALRNLNQVMQGKGRRAYELLQFIKFKESPSDDAVMRAMWGSARHLEDLKSEHAAVSKVEQALKAKADGRWKSVKQRLGLAADLPMERVYHCFLARLAPELYPYRPKISFLIQYWKKPESMQRVLEPILKCKNVVPLEIVVNVDEPSNADLWLDWAYNQTEGLVVPVFSYNIHELRSYNRLMAIARAPIAMLLQDDQFPPAETCAWIENVLALYKLYPRMGAMGHRGWCDSIANQRVCFGGRTLFKEPTTGLDFQFVGASDYAPYSFRRAAYLDIGGIDESAGEPGQCGILSDWEISSRVWLAGWQLGYTYIFTRLDGGIGGTHVGSSLHRCWNKQQGLTGLLFNARATHAVWEEILGLVQQANLGLNLTLPGNECPYKEMYCKGLPYAMPKPDRGF